MQQSVESRKRPAVQQQPMTPQSACYQQQAMPDNTADFNNTNFDFSNSFADPTFAPQAFDEHNQFAATFHNAPAQSTDLVRRARNQHLATESGGVQRASAQQEAHAYGNMKEESETDLEAKVALAKREASGKKKQIPPFVMKLSSFLNKEDNADKIKWSEDGRSFIVLDEDEFARTLIPELFKHNNYASFVRQLNMYGFHKRVDIADGSLRQSESARKGQKPPSMYSHPYFRRNRPDLLWLIQKPTSKSSAKRKRDGIVKGEGDSDDERQYSPGPDGRPSGELGNVGANGLAQMPRTEMAAVRSELKKLQQQQSMISRMISQLKEQNEHFYRQATAFQQLHDRHENSINAILTFLATFYNRSLEGSDGQNAVNMFANQTQNGQQQQQGSVVEEYVDGMTDRNNRQLQCYNKRPQLLLGAPNVLNSGALTPSSVRQSISPPEGNSPQLKRDSAGTLQIESATPGRASLTASPIIKDDAETPNYLNSVPDNNQVMSYINNANATSASNDNTPAFDISALGDYSNGAGGLTPQQRSNMLAMINQHSGGASNENNALISPNAPNMQHHMDHIKQNREQIEALSAMQASNNQSIQNIQDRIGQFSPGATFGSDDANANIPDFIMDDLLHGTVNDSDFNNFDDNNFDFQAAAEQTNPDWNEDYFGEVGGDAEADMFKAKDDEAASPASLGGVVRENLAPGGVGTVESLQSSEAPSPAVREGEDDGEEEEGTSNKRRRVS